MGIARHRSVIAAIGLAVIACVAVSPSASAEEAVPPVVAADPAPTDPASPTDPATPADPTAPPADAAPAAPAAPPAAAPMVQSRLPLREGATGARVRHIQQRLEWLGYDILDTNLANQRMGLSTIAAVKRFQSKVGFRPTGVVGPGTYELLDEVAGPVGRLPKACTVETSICIDKSQRLVRYVEKGKVRLTLDARFGMVGVETREGSFRVNSKSRDHVSSLYRTWMPFALFFSGGQAVHYSPYFARDGYSGASHGCVNLRDMKMAEWLFDRVPVGTRVHVYRS